ncbi:MAG: hypothetical protein ABSC02_12415 [Acidobacteriota bacterium]
MFLKRLRFVLILSAIFVGGPWIVHADTVTLTYTGVNGSNDGQYYTDPYYGQINGGPVIDIWCVDFKHESNYPSSWTVNVTSITGSSNSSFGNTYLCASDPTNFRTDYLEILWLINNYQNPPLDSTAQFTTLQVQYAIWSFSGDSHPDTDPGLRALALSAVNGGYDPSGWSILTDTQGNNQEFIVQYTVPEPSLMLLILIGLSAACILYCCPGCR